MIEQIMYFALGVLTAALVTMALLPALWRRAVRLTRRELEATLPLTPAEIAAERDQIRAAHAIDIRRLETQLEQGEALLQATKTDLGARLTQVHLHETTISAQKQSIEALEGELEDKRSRIGNLEQDIALLAGERDKLIANLSAQQQTGQTLEQELQAQRTLAEQRRLRLAEREEEATALNGKLADSLASVRQLRDDSQKKSDELRQAARKLREAASEIGLANRKLTAAEHLSHDRQTTIEELQAERLALIEEAGLRTRERDHERIERQALQAQIESLSRRTSEAPAEVVASRGRQDETVRDLTRTIEMLRLEKRKADEEMSRLRLDRTMMESELLRLRRAVAAHTGQDVPRPQPAPQPAPQPMPAPAIDAAPPLPPTIGSPALPVEAGERK